LNPVRLGEVPCDRGFEGEIHADAANAANAEDEGLVEVWEDGDIGIGRGSLLPNISMALVSTFSTVLWSQLVGGSQIYLL